MPPGAAPVGSGRTTSRAGAGRAARIAERAFWHLDAPLARLTCLDTPVPYSPPLEDRYLPNADKLVARLRELLAV